MTAETEFEALAAICAAVDGAIEGDPAGRKRVARILGQGDLAGASVAAAILPHLRDRPASTRDELPSVDEALDGLTAIRPQDDAGAARMIAIAGLVDADPAYGRAGEKGDLVLRALTGGDPELAKLAPSLLAQMELLHGGHEVRPTIVKANIARVVLPTGDLDPVPTFHTDFVRRGRTLEDMKRVLNPENWPRCCPWWSRMLPQDAAGGRPHYKETVANSVGFLKVEVCLQFVQAESPDEISLDYRMCNVTDHQPEIPRVVVDEGWIVAQTHPDGVRVLTSKRVQFADTMGGRSLVPTAGGLGYGTLAEELVDSCLDCQDAEVKWAPVEVNDGR